ncbi:MAG: DUF58 domain-containing protein [Deltaproteobacteria bacterium]|nr:DUF58 domain-containing protein [Deltaproteobacteria bacterium]
MLQKGLYKSFIIFNRLKWWTHRRITPAGWLILAALVVSAALGIDTNQSLAFQIFCLLLAVISVSLAVSLIWRLPFKAWRAVPRFGVVGEPLAYRVFIRHESPKIQPGVLIDDQTDIAWPTLDEFTQAEEPNQRQRNVIDRKLGYYRWSWLLNRKRSISAREVQTGPWPPKTTLELRMEALPQRRGHLHLTRLSLARPDPLGLWRTVRVVNASDSILILPRHYPVPNIALPGKRKYQPGGESAAFSVGDSEEFVSLRDYRPGDPLHRIHWKSWAKTEKPVVKEYQDEFFVRHALILDTFQTEETDELFEEAVSVATSLVGNILTQESLLDLMFVGAQAYCFTSGRGIAQIDRMMEILAVVQPCRDKPFGTLEPLILGRAAWLTACLCVFLNWDRERQKLVARLKSLGLPIKVLVVLPAGPKQALDPGPMAIDFSNFHCLELGRVAEGLSRV